MYLVGTTPSIGTAWAIRAISTGKALHAFLQEGDEKRLLKKPLSRFTPRTITDSRELQKELEQARHRGGYATALEEIEDGYITVGAAVGRSTGTGAARQVSVRLGFED